MPSNTKNVRQRTRMNSEDSRRPLIGNRGKKSSNARNGLQVSFLCLIASISLLVFFFGFYSDALHPVVDHISGHLGYHNKTKQFAVVIDAGSTGTRVLAFEFHSGYLDGRLVLDKELFKQLKPGLSSFATDHTKAVDQIEKLLVEAKGFVPREKWAETPIVLKATAGLRLLGPDEANKLLDTARKVLVASGFHTNDESVSIMDGEDEGLFSWFTVNFLSGRLTGTNTIAALDLGGGSTQVTYTLTDEKDLSDTKDFIHSINVLKRTMNVFTHSYLGLGLMATRHAIFTDGTDKTEIHSECVNPIIKNRMWTYGSVDYNINGKENPKAKTPQADFDKCFEKVKRYVQKLTLPKPPSLQKHQIGAFSYYYDRAIETGLVDAIAGGETTIKNFHNQAREACASPNTEQPFMCLDLTFISTLLEYGFGLRQQTVLQLYKKIDGHEISWALGCAYNLLTSGRATFA
ncbi:ectonucleoside triphosphate diphosphohydrolase 5 [Culicoides brevitarsis]|uniref:ectonucleoside triphosphate diphosphohydrolase 5 n=1 Tax=Culicoides brevitarsis TaxID=469753 RepID=UPI00307C579E